MELVEYIEYADIETNTLYYIRENRIFNKISPLPYLFFGWLKEKVDAGEVKFVAITKRMTERAFNEIPKNSE